jgi:ferric-dicitrate binding protein FerR (iron transport regulator)
MAKKSKQAKSASPYVRRLAEDEYVQAQLRNAAGRLREATARARRKRGRAAEDKRLYDNLREAATSMRKAASRLQRKPEPKRRGRKIAAVAVTGGAAALLLRRRSQGQSEFPAERGGGSYDDTGSSTGDGASAGTPSQEAPGESPGNEPKSEPQR